MSYSYKNIKEQLLTDMMPSNDRESNEQIIRQRLLTRRRVRLKYYT